jgi:hypothetical protein
MEIPRKELPVCIQRYMRVEAKGDTAAMPSEEIARWLALAAEARSVADELTDPTARAIMLKIAQGYENLARLAKSRQKSSS